ncbi:MAG: aminotransferase class I/II-fold pyridoxal phosphate-dependent enzyme [Anaerolineae bacterium]|nr:aminotransferase class I/II-fold pyridoxal phosphate-dependent enzyme [Anaerolineae bacterium]MDW8071086.1 aminotransferase class I/II-fold pyridoxal phosphate-dependent enzyme [Anaerolineae bacterium]
MDAHHNATQRRHAENRRADGRYLHRHMETQCLHAGERWEKYNFWSSSTPIYNATTFLYDNYAQLEDRLFYREPGYVYSREGSPTSTALERAISTLEGAETTHVCASGMAASHLALLAAGAGAKGGILCSSDVYGSVYTMVENVFPHLGAPTAFADFTDLNRLEDAMRAFRPRVVYFEVMTNPLTKIIDAPAVIEMAHHYGARVVVDNTFTTPYLMKPFQLGADFVVHSVSKFLSGHGDVLAGSVSCAQDDFDALHSLLIQVGCPLGPNEAWLALRGLKTFALRMERHCTNAQEIARFLAAHPLIERVRYAGLPDHPQHSIAQRIFAPGRYGAMLSFDIAHCDQTRAARFLDALRIILPATTLGDCYSLIVNPATSTHRWLGPERLAALGILPGTFRMSVGLEHVADLQEDLDQALRASQG